MGSGMCPVLHCVPVRSAGRDQKHFWSARGYSRATDASSACARAALSLVRHGAVRVLLPIVIMLPMAAGWAFAADITGTITVKQKLTRPSVTAPVSMYERGPAVELGEDAESDPLAAEKARVVIWVEGPAREAATVPAASAPASMRQINRRFDPDIVVVPMGSSVTFPNLDPIFHNVFSLSKPKSFDLGNYPKGDTRTVVFPKPGIVYVNCRLHPNMIGAVVVTPNQWYAKAGEDGQFTLRDLTAGTYTVVAWHKSAGFFRKEVQVVKDRDSVVDFVIPLDVKPADAGADMIHMGMVSK
jgi:plastocyanin